jgi:hypothetical protein
VPTAGLSLRAGLLVAYAAVVGVGIDFDHFPLARFNDGDWRATRRLLRNPRLALFEQSGIFEEGQISPLQRLLSHVVVTGLLVGTLALVDPFLAVFTAVVLYAHVLADLYADNRKRGLLPWQETRGAKL